MNNHCSHITEKGKVRFKKMNHKSIEILGNHRLEELVKKEYSRFKSVIDADTPIGEIESKVKEIALTEYLDEDKLRSVVEEIQEEISESARKKMQDIMYCNISALIFKDLSISMYNAKRVFGVDKAFDIIREQIKDPLIIGNIVLLILSIEMETN